MTFAILPARLRTGFRRSAQPRRRVRRGEILTLSPHMLRDIGLDPSADSRRSLFSPFC